MREIKFRAWDKRKNTWIHKDLFFISNAGFYEDYRELEDGISLFDYEYDLMQYTGLKDKNGKEIYEGDVTKEGNIITQIVFRKGRFEEKLLSSPLSHTRDYFPLSENGEVIGNIYENPELLKE